MSGKGKAKSAAAAATKSLDERTLNLEREFTNLLSHYTHIAREVISLRVVVNLQQLQVQAIHAVLQQAAQSGGEGNQFFAEAGEDGNTISPEQQIALLQELMNVTTGQTDGGGAIANIVGEGAAAATAAGAVEEKETKGGSSGKAAKKAPAKAAKAAAGGGGAKGKRTRSASSVSSSADLDGPPKRRRGSRDAGKQAAAAAAAAAPKLARPRRSSRS